MTASEGDVFDFPASNAQKRLWFTHQLNPESAAYNIPVAFQLQGQVNIDALRGALNDVVARHEALRTTFEAPNGQPRQIVAPHLTLEVPLNDLRSLPATQREEEVQRRVEAVAYAPFDLRSGPLIRARLIQLASAHYVLVLSMHHIVSDGWSLGVLARELEAHYAARMSNADCRLPDLAIQYPDYTLWHQKWVSEQVINDQLPYWREQLEDGVPPLELPVDAMSQDAKTFRGGGRTIAIGADRVAELRSIGATENATLFQVTLAAFKALLYRYTNQRDISIGTPVAHRPRLELESLIGFFANTLVLRTQWAGDPSFRTLLRKVRETTLGAYDHQDVPFEHLVQELQPERDLRRNPFFQVLFMLQNPPMQLELPGLEVDRYTITRKTSKFDLVVELWEHDGEIRGEIEYDADLFDKATIDRMVGHYKQLLKGVTANPGHLLSELPVLTPAEREQVLVTQNATSSPYPREQTVHELVEAQAEKNPDVRAVVHDEDAVTYRGLNRAADRFARRLRTAGVNSGTRVGLYVPRSIDMIVGVLGILKAGGAYVPLDPADPDARIQFIIEDSEISVVVIPSAIAADGRWEGVVHVPLDDSQKSAGEIFGQTGDATGDDMAYVLHTSGSTGKPKGVMMPHRPLVNLLTWQGRQPGFDRPARVLQYAPLGFDVSFQEIVSTLSAGGTLHLIDESMRRDFGALLRYVNEHRIERVFFPFVALQQLCKTAMQQEVYPRCLRQVITAGEQLKVGPAMRQFFKSVAPCTLYNQYGPTETHVVTQHVLSDDVAGWPKLPPIGRPIANTSIYILDPQGNPLPVGVPGELHVGGDALADGYCNRPTETEHRFRSRALTSSEEVPLYATGDRAKYRSDGTIEFLGRLDRQVKIRGYRVEPGEVEAALNREPSVQQAAVRATSTEPQRLVAYVVPTDDNAVKGLALRRALRKELPDYMVPDRVVPVTEFPMTPSGKVDYAALPELGQIAPNRKEGTKPRTDRERLLTDIVADALQVDTVGVEENLFDLGVNSLMIAQIVRSVQEAEMPLTIRDFFAYQTIAGLAARAKEVETSRREREEALRARIKQMAPHEVKRLLQEKRNQ